MYNYTGTSIDELYVELLKDILQYGETTKPRGFTCKEMSPCSIELLNPQRNILMNPIRKASKTFMGAELLWILMGRNDVDMISFYNSKISQFSDDGKEFFGSYGPKITGQFTYVIENLKKDPWSRQAVINIWREAPPATKDVPCTVALHFLRRPTDTLNLVVYMRSQDIWLGFPYDVHNFTSIQLIAASILGCMPGTFTLIQGSLHMYEQDFEKAQEAAKIITVFGELTPLPKIDSLDVFNCLGAVKGHEEWYRRKPEPTDYASHDFQSIGDPLLDQKMKWLHEFANKKRASA